MLLKNKYQLFAFISFVLLVLIAAFIYYQFWGNLTSEEQKVIGNVVKNYIGYIFIALVLIIFALGMALDQFLNTYILPLKRTVEELNIVSSVNISHRLSQEGNKDIESLSHLINKMADRIEISEHEIDETIRQSGLELEEEKNRLAAVISGLPEGVIICNLNWQIVLYNQKAKSFFSKNVDDKDSNGSFEILGLGRSILGTLDKNQIVHAFDELTNRLDKGEGQIGYHFAHAADQEHMLDIHVIPILTGKGKIDGFVLVLNDITRKMVVANQRDLYLESLITSIRSAISGIRAAVETILDFPDMKREELDKLRRIILDESITLSRFIEQPETEIMLDSETEWPMEDFQCHELLAVIRKKAESALEMDIAIDEKEEDLWVHIDSFSIVHAVVFLISKLESKVKPISTSCRITKSGKSVVLDIYWKGDPISPEILKKWRDEHMEIGAETIPLTLRKTIKQHKTEIWPQITTDGFPCLRMMLPLLPAKAVRVQPNSAISIESRTEFYDFDMFNQTAVLSDFGDVPLRELIYTVFDTETTGLNPKVDEIISIGALRIVNGRLLREESFDKLVNPLRSVPKESIRFHGIQGEMLEGQPDIKAILPMFRQFTEETVLVGHNAAFDMRMLQEKEETTGITFANPVLDTLLLSAVINPAQTNHNLEAIAKRLGIRIIGRHTALGDAMVTGELFLKMIPLLETKNILTLKQAIEASKKTYYARLKY